MYTSGTSGKMYNQSRRGCNAISIKRVCIGSGLIGNIVAKEHKDGSGEPGMAVSLYTHEPLQQTDRLYRRLNGLEPIQALGKGTGPWQSSARPSGEVCFNFVSARLAEIARGRVECNHNSLQDHLQASQKT